MFQGLFHKILHFCSGLLRPRWKFGSVVAAGNVYRPDQGLRVRLVLEGCKSVRGQKAPPKSEIIPEGRRSVTDVPETTRRSLPLWEGFFLDAVLPDQTTGRPLPPGRHKQGLAAAAAPFLDDGGQPNYFPCPYLRLAPVCFKFHGRAALEGRRGSSRNNGNEGVERRRRRRGGGVS